MQFITAANQSDERPRIFSKYNKQLHSTSMKKLLVLFICFFLALHGCAQTRYNVRKQIGGPCEDCQMMFDGMPEHITHRVHLAAADEPGDRLVIGGTIYQPDGKTPAEGIILYVYHTDNNGLYSRGADQKYAIRHGHLRGWVKTNVKGEYEINTIRPASYPQSKSPQHIHPIVFEPTKGYYWIDEYVFEDDPFLTDNERSKASNRGGSGIIRLIKNKNGVWEGRRDIVLGLHVENQ
jgi:protocatechuate 3,4-dioxygenase beta subunit